MKSKCALFLAIVLVLLSSAAQAQVLRFSDNGHFYEYVPFNGTILTWEEARVAATQRQYEGIPGYLVTITSAEENAFIVSQFEVDADDPFSAGFAWVGGYEPADDGVWLWADGPEASIQYSQINVPVPPFNYANWAPNEPNDPVVDGEDFMMIELNLSSPIYQPGEWNDLPNDSEFVAGYIVEYSVPESQPVPVNSLSWMLLLLVGILAVGLLRVRAA